MSVDRICFSSAAILKGEEYMIEIFGKESRLDTLLYYIVWISSMLIIGLNIFYFLKFGSSLMNKNLLTGFVLLIFSTYNLYNK